MLSPQLSSRIRRLRWALPVVFGALAVLYELGPGRWLHDELGARYYFNLDILFYGTVAPVLTFWTLTRLGQWLDDKERLEQQARATEQRLASITAASADAILSLDPAGRIQSWNRGAELIFGYTPEQVLGRPFVDLFGGGAAAEVEFYWLVESVQRAGFVRGHETVACDAGGRHIPVELTATHLTDDSGRCLGISVILRDITERQQREADINRLNSSLREQVAERTRELAQKVDQLALANADLKQLDRLRSQFVSLVSHQLRAPLTNMQAAVEHIEGNCSAMNGTCERMLAILNQQVGRLDRLVRDVLNTARVEAGELVLEAEPVSVLPVIQQAVEHIRPRAAGRPFRLPTKPGLPLVFADRDRMAEVLGNLLDNADKYSPAGKDVWIDVRADEAEVTLSVRDAGPGIPAEHLDRIFDKFYRADNSDSQAAYGYGLGLYVCRLLVTAQGGQIWAENHPAGGAVVSFTLPVVH
jgi:PAS domain S-box-containing protein